MTVTVSVAVAVPMRIPVTVSFTVTLFVAFPLAAVAGGTPEENAATFRALLCSGKDVPASLEPVMDFVLMNAAALLVVAGVAADLKEGVAKARESIMSGKAWEAFEKFRDAGLAQQK